MMRYDRKVVVAAKGIPKYNNGLGKKCYGIFSRQMWIRPGDKFSPNQVN
jgi:hypothetical protein